MIKHETNETLEDRHYEDELQEDEERWSNYLLVGEVVTHDDMVDWLYMLKES